MKHVNKRDQIIAMRLAGKSLGVIAKKLKMGKGNVAWYWDNYKAGNKTKAELKQEVERLAKGLPKAARQGSELECLLADLPDHFQRGGREYSLMIVKDKKGMWQILYADLNKNADGRVIKFVSYSEDKNYKALADAAARALHFVPKWKNA